MPTITLHVPVNELLSVFKQEKAEKVSMHTLMVEAARVLAEEEQRRRKALPISTSIHSEKSVCTPLE